MTDLEVLFKVVDRLTAEELKQLRDHIEQLEHSSSAGTKQPQPRTPDLFPGIWVSEDFNEPLPDGFWLGEE
jgi:hypothetical protein